MGNIYSQWTAVVNIIFTAAALALIIARFNEAHPVLKVLMALLFLIFPVLQPTAVWIRSVRQSGAIEEDTTLSIGDDGFGIRVRDHRQLIYWRDFNGALRRWGLMVLIPDKSHAYLLPDRVTGESAGEVYDFIKKKLGEYNGKK